MQTVAKYMGVPIGQMRNLAAEGKISAEVVKNALLASADETNKMFESMPKTWAQQWNWFCNIAIQKFRPVLQKINDIANSERFEVFAINVTNALQEIAYVATEVFDALVSGVNFVADNWNTIGPPIWAAVAAMAAFRVVTLLATAAQKLLNLEMLKNPFFWVAMAVGYLVIKLIEATEYVGGLKNAFSVLGMCIDILCNWFKLFGMIIYNFAVTAWENLQTLSENIEWCWTALCSCMEEGMVNMAANVLSTIQNLCNGIMSSITSLVNALDVIPGVEIEAPKVSFGDNAQKFASAVKAQNDTNLIVSGVRNMANKQMRNRNQIFRGLSIQTQAMANETQQYIYGRIIGSYHASTIAGKGKRPVPEDGYGSFTQPFNTEALDAAKDTAANTGRMADALDIVDEDLKYLRDIAGQQAINRFTTAEVKLDMINYNTVHGEPDLDGITQTLADKLHEALSSAAERSHV